MSVSVSGAGSVWRKESVTIVEGQEPEEVTEESDRGRQGMSSCQQSQLSAVTRQQLLSIPR